jgi:rhodanese-related sulfurtransferase
LDHGQDVKLIMTMHPHAYYMMHIPGSLNFENLRDALTQLDPEEEVVVYCSNRLCSSSINAYQLLRRRGFQKLYRYDGGLEDWQSAGYPLEGSLVAQ